MIIKIFNDGFKLVRTHLSVGKTYAHVGHQLAYHIGHRFNIFDPVMDEKYLPAAGDFLQYGIAYKILVKTVDFSLNRLAVGRRCMDDAQVAVAHQWKLQ